MQWCTIQMLEFSKISESYFAWRFCKISTQNDTLQGEFSIWEATIAMKIPDQNPVRVRVKVATRLLVFRSITLAAPEERLTTRNVRLDPTLEQNWVVDPCGGLMICVRSSSSKSALGPCAQAMEEHTNTKDNSNCCRTILFSFWYNLRYLSNY